MENRIAFTDKQSTDGALMTEHGTQQEQPFTADASWKEFHFETFRIRGATHLETVFTIHRDGRWSSRSCVKTGGSPFKPQISLSLEFFRKSTGMQVPVGCTELDWSPKVLWSSVFGKNDEKVIEKKGTSDFVRQFFDVLHSDAEGKLKMRLQRRESWISRLF